MRPLILKTGSAIPELIGRRGDFEHYCAKALGLSERQYDVLDAGPGGRRLQRPRAGPATGLT